MSDSPPSSEKRFCPWYFVCRKCSKLSTFTSWRRMRRCTSAGTLDSGARLSIFSRSQLRTRGFWTCMNSVPIGPQ